MYSSLAGSVSPASIQVSKKIGTDLHVNQDVANQTVASHSFNRTWNNGPAS